MPEEHRNLGARAPSVPETLGNRMDRRPRQEEGVIPDSVYHQTEIIRGVV